MSLTEAIGLIGAACAKAGGSSDQTRQLERFCYRRVVDGSGTAKYQHRGQCAQGASRYACGSACRGAGANQ